MEDGVLARRGGRPGSPAPAGAAREPWPADLEGVPRGEFVALAGAASREPAATRIDLVAAERVSASVVRLLAAIPQNPSPVAVRRWLLAAERLLPLSKEHDRARLLQARAGLRAVAGAVDSGRAADATVHDAADAGELFERLGDSLAAATNFAVASSTAARDGRINVALEIAVRALVCLGRAVRHSDRERRDPAAEAELAARLGALCRQLFDFPRALRFFELALDALDGSGVVESTAPATLAVGELLLLQVGELAADAEQRPVLLDRAERLAQELCSPGSPEVFRLVHGPRLLADVRCERGQPAQAWPLLLAAGAALAARSAGTVTARPVGTARPEAAGCVPSDGTGDAVVGLVHLSAGRCLLLLERYAEAAGELDLAVERLSAPSDPGESHLAEIMVALRLRSSARERSGDVCGALADERRLADLLWLRHRNHVGGFMDQVWSRAGAEEERRDLQEQAEALLAHAEQDPLTGLANRRALERFCRQLLPGGEVSLVLLDVDHFKDVNDRFGHAVGDAVLRSLAGVLTRSVRTMDVVARWGGEEFLIALPGGSGRLGADAADRVCRRVRTHPWHRLAEGLAVTVSVGVASGPASGLDVVLGRADTALYAAKHGGRDRTVVG
jgi:diguanylate cyclase (GGDEF)-like protein